MKKTLTQREMDSLARRLTRNWEVIKFGRVVGVISATTIRGAEEVARVEYGHPFVVAPRGAA